MLTISNTNREDFLWSETGDFLVRGGDLRDSRETKGLGFVEEVERRMKSSYGDWKLNEEDGANMHLFRGRNNEEKTWKEICDSIVHGLTYDSFLSSLDFEVFVVPISYSEVAIRVEFADNIKNKLSEKVQSVKVVFNLNGEGPYIMR